ncbi:MAG: hypothetical protein ACRD8Z_09915 [Nitrososphaeraceae archaeon]
MQSIENRENAILSNVKEKIVITEAGQQSPEARGEVAAREQIRIFGQVFDAANSRYLNRQDGLTPNIARVTY